MAGEERERGGGREGEREAINQPLLHLHVHVNAYTEKPDDKLIMQTRVYRRTQLFYLSIGKLWVCHFQASAHRHISIDAQALSNNYHKPHQPQTDYLHWHDWVISNILFGTKLHV